jgi:hypothetical protein
LKEISFWKVADKVWVFVVPPFAHLSWALQIVKGCALLLSAGAITGEEEDGRDKY